MDLVIRADAAGPAALQRALALASVARAWQSAGGRAVYAAADGWELLAEPLARSGIEIERLRALSGGSADAHETAALAAKLGARWLLLAEETFPSLYRRTLAAAGLLVCVCAAADGELAGGADLVLDPRIEAGGSQPHSVNSGHARARVPRRLVGPRYALVRRELAVWRGRTLEHPERAGRVLLALDGPGAEQGAQVVGEAIRLLARPEVEVRALVPGAPGRSAELMAWSELAVTSPGTTAVEAAFMGLPQLVVVASAKERRAAEALAELGLGEVLDLTQDREAGETTERLAALLDDRPWRALISARARELIDGLGGERVAQELLNAA